MTGPRSPRIPNVSIDRLRERLSYDASTGRLTWLPRAIPTGPGAREARAWNTHYAGKEALGYTDAKGYKRGSVQGEMLLAHRVAWALHHGRWPEHLLDHIDGDPSNNAVANLREVDSTGNARNTALRRSSSTGATGVSWHAGAGRYLAQIGVAGRVIYLGLHDTIEQASEARKAADARYGFHPNHGRAGA